MKKSLFLLTITSFLCNAQVTSFPWTETFEDSSPTSTQWVCEYISGSNSSVPSGLFWSIKSATSVGYYSINGPHLGTKMAVFDTRSHSRDAKARFVSPVINLSSVQNPKLNFYYRNMTWGNDQNELKIFYRTSAIGTWNLITTFNTNVPTWANSGEITLPEPSSTYQIALEGLGMYGYGLDVDDLVVKDGVLSTYDIDKQKTSISIYPNPASDFLHIKSEKSISEVSIFDSTGKQISRIKEKNSEAKIPVHYLNSGIYLIQIKNSEGIVSKQKFIKK